MLGELLVTRFRKSCDVQESESSGFQIMSKHVDHRNRVDILLCERTIFVSGQESEVNMTSAELAKRQFGFNKSILWKLCRLIC